MLKTGIAWREARNHFEAQSAKDGLVPRIGVAIGDYVLGYGRTTR